MADEIKSVLGFDISGALSQLDILDTALAKNAAAFQSLGSSLDAFNTKGATIPATLAKISASANQTINDLLGVQKAQASLANLGMSSGGSAIATSGGQNINAMLGMADAAGKVETAMTSAGNAGKRAGDSITLSWQTFGRVIQTQALIRGINEIRDALEFATKSFIEYSKTISEIAAIDPSRKFDEISASVRQMSDSFNQPILKVAEAQYQILSAQFTTVADQTNIMTAANELAKVTNQSLDTSVNILTGTLNAYGESSDMAALRAGQFFETVSLGRVRTADLATALGRVQTIAHLSGVSIEELDAAMVSLSIGGVKSTEAATQLRGVLTALLKPSQDMKAAFTEIGVSSGPAAIATFGLQGAVQKLMETTGGAAEEMQKLMPNVRGFAGGARLAESGADAYRSALEKIQNLPSDLLKQKEMELAATSAEQLTTEINKVKNALTVDVGADLTRQLSTLMTLIGQITGTSGGAVLGNILTSFADQIPYFVAGLGAIAAGLVVLKVESFAATQGVGSLKMGLVSLLALAPMAMALGQAIGESINAASRAAADKLTVTTNEELESNKRAATVKEQLEINLLNTKMQLVRQGLLEADKIYIQDVANFETSMKETEKIASKSFENIASARKSLSNELKSLSESEYANQEANSKKIGDLMAKQSERNFEYNLKQTGGDTQFQFDAYVKHAQDLAAAAAKMTAEAKDPAQKAAADEMWQRADAAGQTANKLADSLNITYDTQKAFKLLNTLDTQREQSLAKQNVLSGTIAADLEKRSQNLAKSNEELEKLALEIQEKYKAIAKDEAAGDKGKDKLAKDMEDLQSLTADYAAKTKSAISDAVSGGFMADPKVFDKLKRDADRALNSIDIQNITIMPSALATALSALQAQADKMTLLIPAEIRQGSGTDVQRQGSAIGVTQEYQKQQDLLIKQKGTLDNIAADQKTLVNELNASIAATKYG
jgi:TP901 family phage tail tape measure protein